MIEAIDSSSWIPSEPELAYDLLAPGYGFLSVFIAEEGSKETRYAPIVRRDGRGAVREELSPGESRNTWIPIYVSSDGWTMPRPGRYRVRAEYAAEGEPVVSAPLELTVVEPDSARARQAAELFMQREAALYFALEGAEQFPKGRAAMEVLTEDYADTPLAPYAQLALGREATVRRFDPTSKTFVEGDCDAASRRLRIASTEIPDPFYAAQGTAALSECLKVLGREAEAEAAIREFEEAHPEARRLPGLAVRKEGAR